MQRLGLIGELLDHGKAKYELYLFGLAALVFVIFALWTESVGMDLSRHSLFYYLHWQMRLADWWSVTGIPVLASVVCFGLTIWGLLTVWSIKRGLILFGSCFVGGLLLAPFSESAAFSILLSSLACFGMVADRARRLSDMKVAGVNRELVVSTSYGALLTVTLFGLAEIAGFADNVIIARVLYWQGALLVWLAQSSNIENFEQMLFFLGLPLGVLIYSGVVLAMVRLQARSKS